MQHLSALPWASVSNHLDRLLELPLAQRQVYLEALAREDPAIHRHLRRLLAGAGRPGFADFLEGRPALVAPLEDAATLVGRAVGPWLIEARIGAGGMGSVWRARRTDGRFDAPVAIKFLHAAWTSAAAEERFRLEGRLLSRLDHPHIARLLDAGVLDGAHPYLVLELVEGEPIDQFCDRHALPTAARIRLMLDVIAAVAHAHSHLIVHRDIKPANIFVTAGGVVKLLDFGIAKLLQDEPRESAALSVTRALTPQYAAPEQLLGQPVTTATDVYALGLVLFRVLTGRSAVPADTGSMAELVQTIVQGSVPRPSEVAVGPPALRRMLAGDLDNIVARALEKDPGQRYAGAEALAADLRRHLAHEPVLARAVTWRYRVAKFVRRYRGSVAAAAAAVLALMTSTGLALWQAHEARAQRGFAYRQLERAEFINDLNGFLVNEAAPGGAPFTARQLLARAERLVSRQKSAVASRIGMLVSIGRQYYSLDDGGDAIRVLQAAYDGSRHLGERSVRAEAACAFGALTAERGDIARGEALLAQGLRELPQEAQYAFDQAFCEVRGAEAAHAAGDARLQLERVRAAQAALAEAPFRSEVLELHALIDLGMAYYNAGQFDAAVRSYAAAAALIGELGREGTESHGTLLNDWALALASNGRPLEAEPLYRRAIEIGRSSRSDAGVSPMLMLNYAKDLEQLARLPEAMDWAVRAYARARQQDDPVIVHQAQIALSRLYREQGDLARASALLDDVEPALRAALPPKHIAFAALATERSQIAAARGDLPGALAAADAAVRIATESVAGGGTDGTALLPVVLARRARVLAGLGQLDAAERDARRATALAGAGAPLGAGSTRGGQALLVLGQVLASEGRVEEARAAARQSVASLTAAVGAAHPDTLAARALATLVSPQGNSR